MAGPSTTTLRRRVDTLAVNAAEGPSAAAGDERIVGRVSDSPVTFAVAGTGWRAAFFLRAAAAMPDRLRATGVLTRGVGRGIALASAAVPVHTDLDALLRGKPSFVVTAVPSPMTPVLVRELAARGVPVLAETPPAPDLAGLDAILELARRPPVPIEVAEQYHLQPLHAARLAVAATALGTVSQAQVSAAHDYHGIDLIRRFLGAGFGRVLIRARRFDSPIVAGPDRAGPPAQERVAESRQTLAWLDFGGRLGVYDFADDQYFSWIRSPRVLVRGERGEINGETVRRLLDARTPVTEVLERRDAGREGNLEGFHHVGYTLGGRWVYRNPTAPARLSDDEIAVAGCLLAMAERVGGGPSRCSLADAAWDHELGLRIAEAAASGREVTADGSRWAVAG